MVRINIKMAYSQKLQVKQKVNLTQSVTDFSPIVSLI